MKKISSIFAVLTLAVVLAAWAPQAEALPGYAGGAACGVCHVNPAGGGALTCVGTEWAATRMNNDDTAALAAAETTCAGGGNGGGGVVGECSPACGPNQICECVCVRDDVPPPPPPGPPADHTDAEDGVLHKPGKDMPFTNGCTMCHGQDLMGGSGPSCYACHGMEWDEKMGKDKIKKDGVYAPDSPLGVAHISMYNDFGPGSCMGCHPNIPNIADWPKVNMDGDACVRCHNGDKAVRLFISDMVEYGRCEDCHETKKSSRDDD